MSASSWLPEELHPVALRLARADQLSYDLAMAALDWSRGDGGNGPVALQQVERTPGFYDFEVTAIRPVPPVASMLFSEAIHHLRSAVDNVVFHLVEVEVGSPLSESTRRLVSMLIYDKPEPFDQKVERLARQGLPMLSTVEPLGRRIASLQPFADDARVGSLSSALAEIMDIEVLSEHPLALLRDYSNQDKHWSIRLAAARLLVQRDDEWRRSVQQGMREIEVGAVLETVKKGTLTPVEVSAALHVQRPDGTWVAFGPELDGIARYVADIAIPTLVTGLAVPGGIPVQVDLGDSGVETRDRLRLGGSERAHERAQPVMRAALDEAVRQGFRWAPVVDQGDEVTQT